ncbi:MAG TPA: potassium transporter Kup [Kofleriaceae bacterium]|nr:potassium transporter Kup [Kofleriaceae bacterium]
MTCAQAMGLAMVKASRENDRTRAPALTASVGALGIVFGDIGTSPLYALRESLASERGAGLVSADVLGVLSLVFWVLILIISVKYIAFVMRADNRGEGGILALMALAIAPERQRRRTRTVIYLSWLGLFGTAMFFGDGVITPAISVLSAVEGIEVATPVLEPFVVPFTLVILTALFAFQRSGTGRVGALFGPIMILWFAILAALGLLSIIAHPGVLVAANPALAVEFFARNGSHSILVLGSLFLVITGGEALYADMGHFGARPIRRSWFAIALPALLLNYFGQGALVIANPAAIENPFFRLAPRWALFPLVVVATVATIIASQAVISGISSLAMQAVQLGYSPRLKIIHTSARAVGQIYIPAMNWGLYIAVIGTVLGFQSSTNLASAYGVAVTATMVITTVLLYRVARDRWRWSAIAAGALIAGFLAIDLTFFGANLLKIDSGGWFPLCVGGLVYLIYSTWKRGRAILRAKLRATALPLETLLADFADAAPTRVPGIAFFLTSNPHGVPSALLHSLKHMKVLHETIVLLTISTRQVPRVRKNRLMVKHFSHGFHRVSAHFGFMEAPDIPHILKLCAAYGIIAAPHTSTFILGREALIPSRRLGMARWRKRLFARMSQNATSAAAYFGLPANRVVEIGAQIEF